MTELLIKTITDICCCRYHLEMLKDVLIDIKWWRQGI